MLWVPQDSDVLSRGKRVTSQGFGPDKDSGWGQRSPSAISGRELSKILTCLTGLDHFDGLRLNGGQRPLEAELSIFVKNKAIFYNSSLLARGEEHFFLLLLLNI